MFLQRVKKSWVWLALIFNALPAAAQSLPDAGVLRQQIEQEFKPAPAVPAIPTVVAPPPLTRHEGSTLVVRTFKFAGNTRLGTEALQAIVAPYLNRPLSFSQLQEAATDVANAYRKAGWIVRTYLPQQEIENGVVTLAVVEAVFGGVRFAGPSSTRMANERIQKFAEHAQKVAEPVNALAIDRALLILTDMPGVAIDGSLREGVSTGQTDLFFKVQNKPLVNGDVAIDNTGSRSTGENRLAGNIFVNSPLGIGDQLASNLMFSEGSRYGRLAFSSPVAYDGWRAGLSGSYMSYHLVAPEMVSLQAQGLSTTVGGEASYPVMRSRLKNLYLALNYDHKYFDNAANQNTTTRYSINTLALGLNGNLVDTLLGGGVNSAGLTWVQGTANLNGSPNQSADAATTRVDGRFNKIRYSINRLQTIAEKWSTYLAVSGQQADKNLDSGEKFYLGGVNGVRAYSGSEAGGADGQLLNVELRTRLAQDINLTGFYDWGHVTVNHNNDFSGASAQNDIVLRGAGLAVGWTAKFGLSLKATWARRIGENPNPTAAGNDQDGTLVRDRLWLSASQVF